MKRQTAYIILAVICMLISSICASAEIFTDNCSDTSNTKQKVYENFESTSKVNEIFSISLGEGRIPSCIFPPIASSTPKVDYRITGGEKITINIISATSNILMKNNSGEILLGYDDLSAKPISDRAFIDENGIAFIGGKALSFFSGVGYIFSEPFECKSQTYLGPNLVVKSAIDGSEKIVRLNCSDVSPVKRTVGGYAYLETYTANIPKNTSVISLSISNFSNVWDGKRFRRSQIKYPTAISHVQIEGEKLFKVEKKPSTSKDKKPSNKGSSAGKEKLDIKSDVQVSSQIHSYSETTIYDNDTVIQNFGTQTNEKEAKSETLSSSNFGSDTDNSLNELMDQSKEDDSPSSNSEDTTWKLAGTLYLSIGVGALAFALLRKKG